MSYARKGLDGSHVYVYTTGENWICRDCSLAVVGHVHCESPAGMLAHLQAHVAHGEHVPAAALERLTQEAMTPPPADP